MQEEKMAQARDDLYEAVNGEWLAQAEIPEDKHASGGFNELNREIEELLIKELEQFDRGEIEPETKQEAEMVRFYRLAKDFERRDNDGATPLQPDIERVLALKDLSDLQQFAVDAEWRGLPLPFGVYVAPDMKNTDIYELTLYQGGTILPDKSMYGEGHPERDKFLAIFRESSEKVLQLVGFDKDEAEQYVKETLAFDDALWPLVRSSEDLADYVKAYNPRSIEEVEQYSSHFSFTEWLTALVGAKPEKVIVQAPEYFEKLDQLVNEEHFQALRSWILVHTVLSGTGLLSEELRQAGGVYDRALAGIPKAPSQQKSAYYLTRAQYDQVLGRHYGLKYFGPKARADVESMVKAMIAVYKERLSKNDWLSSDTVEKAIVKLDAIDMLIGYPDTVPPLFDKFVVDETQSLYENSARFGEESAKFHFGRWHQQVDRREWEMSADMVNAYYEPSANLICFPAGILQAPFYSLDQHPSANYGGIGAVMGHEISHAFDNNGAQFDERGNLNNWWTDQDYKIFREKSQAMIDEFEGLPLEGGKVNGKLTVSENIADAGGMNAALRALPDEERDDVLFFENWARVWCQKERPEYTQMLLTIDVHAPHYWRANKQPQNVQAFYDAFHVQPGDKMYLEPEKRVVIW